ncbi:hypothetical protein B0T22DRAFT_469884 [Podospora appendiculata]|uniref:Uncharacterized protein n=1 Tax=Podospora appendiculata TaxID=314037 RepID=A0AAE0X3V6_9PEZI|nr:hypothetical protein B0T22DRAFT_469884 [Podospora appendiculata]
MSAGWDIFDDVRFLGYTHVVGCRTPKQARRAIEQLDLVEPVESQTARLPQNRLPVFPVGGSRRGDHATSIEKIPRRQNKTPSSSSSGPATPRRLSIPSSLRNASRWPPSSHMTRPARPRVSTLFVSSLSLSSDIFFLPVCLSVSLCFVLIFPILPNTLPARCILLIRPGPRHALFLAESMIASLLLLLLHRDFNFSRRR